MGAALQGLDVDGPKGGANAAWIRTRGSFVRPSPEERPETRDATVWGAAKALFFPAPSGAPAPSEGGRTNPSLARDQDQMELTTAHARRGTGARA